jgi:hypothetical protein
VRIALVCLGASLVLGCKDKPKNPPVGPQQGSAAVPDAAAKAGSASDPESEIVLPKLSGMPPTKAKPYSAQTGEALGKLEYKGFKKDVRRSDDKGLDVRYRTETRPYIAVTLTLQPCFKCTPMDLDLWQKQKDSLKVLLSPELRTAPDTVFELGKVNMVGATVISQYQVGYINGADQSGAQMLAYSDAYALYYNDGTNMIRVVAEYKDDPPATRDDMLRLVPRADLEKIALAFLDAYTHAW